MLENLIERVAVLPKEAQEVVVRSVLEIEQRHTAVFMSSTTRSASISYRRWKM